MAIIQHKPMSNLQAELLKLYANDLDDNELKEIKAILGKHFAEKATDAMDKVWEEKSLSKQDMVNWTNEHSRYKGRN